MTEEGKVEEEWWEGKDEGENRWGRGRESGEGLCSSKNSFKNPFLDPR